MRTERAYRTKDVLTENSPTCIDCKHGVKRYSKVWTGDSCDMCEIEVVQDEKNSDTLTPSKWEYCKND